MEIKFFIHIYLFKKLCIDISLFFLINFKGIGQIQKLAGKKQQERKYEMKKSDKQPKKKNNQSPKFIKK